MENEPHKTADDRDVFDWIILSGAAGEKELAGKFSVSRKALAPIIDGLEERGVVKRKRGLLFKTIILFNGDSEQGRIEKNRLLPSASLVGAEKMFKTNLDVLKTLVDRFGSIGLGRVAGFFRTRRETVEDWAKILHSQGLIVLFYPLVGEPVLLRVGEKQSIINETLVRYLILLLLVLAVIYERNQLVSFLKNVR